MGDVLKKFSKQEFNTEEPYLILYELRDDGWRYMQTFNALEDNAKDVGFNNFRAMVKAFFDQRSEHGRMGGVVNNSTNFKDQPAELFTGDWIADDTGIMKRNPKHGMDIACVHPIMPVQRLVNIEDGTVRLKIAFRRDGKSWQDFVANKSQLYSAREIKKLADKDVSVSDKNASYLVTYLQEIEDLNHDLIPEKQSVNHLGWTRGGDFSPYVENLEFDGIDNFRRIFESVHAEGELGAWVDVAKKVRKSGFAARMALAASFASVLVKAIGKLNFIVHFWGGSGTGKTVALLAAASVWANPNDDGNYMQTFNGTAVGLEMQAGFINNLPLILDEFQLVKDKKSFEYSVYLLTEGIGKTRGAKTGGLQSTATWRNCTITSGEMPITHESIGGGAINRIVEVECKEKLFDDPVEILEAIRGNYGHAGKIFVELLDGAGARKEAKELYDGFYHGLKDGITEKQAMAAALILTADALSTKWIFRDGRALRPGDVRPYLKSIDSVDTGKRGFDYVYGFCVENAGRFKVDADVCYGRMSEDELTVIGTSFNRICDEGGYNPDAVLGWLEKEGMLIKDRSGKRKKVVKINGKNIRCVCIDLRKEGEQPDWVTDFDQEELPFK